ncbi:amidohydrolase [Oceanobacillus polygoni]|uniref:Amidohydrolase YtcJ n=1 Tax=Oceanobacillus polygoni TaxID=1235259 RepID=A0A9X1CEF4_9BACI|nr:amidohydrolase [Oceanobacillus polygoni]MBP2077035.1 putative amidohydrolase YtcJ [Oceanobacillus polygoni]
MENIDLLITNATILTLDKQNSRSGSLAVTNGRISGIWTESEPPSTIILTPRTEVLNLNGRTIIPGFIDTHNHILMYALNKNKVNCSTPPNSSVDDILERVKLMAIDTPKGKWIEGYGYDDTLLKEQRHPTREELDRVAPDHPVFLTHISSHFAAVNSKALILAGIDESVSNPRGGHFGRDINGRLDGVLHEIPAMEYVQKYVPVPSVDEMITALGEGSKDYLSQGITTNSDAGVGLFIGEAELEAHIVAAKEGINPMRSQLMVMHTLLRKGEKFGNYSAEQLNEEIMKSSNGNARLDSAKMFQDGSIQGLTGALREPYYNNPDVVGELLYHQEAFNEEILDLHRRGFRVTIHGNGDRAIGSILDSYSYALEKAPKDNHRHRIEHVQTATIDDLDKMKQLSVAGSVFINHVYYWGDRHKRLFLGPERASRISPLADMVDRDILFTLHSDCPVTPISPLFSVWAAVNRLTKEGEILGADQRIDVVTALKSMTIFGAKLNFNEANVGSIEIGKQADFTVLGDDPTQVNPMEIKDIPVEATLIGGKIVYEKEGALLG